MAVDDFIPELWTAKILVALRKKAVAGQLVNRDYEGEIRRAGNTVNITSINDVTISDYTEHTDISFEDIDAALEAASTPGATDKVVVTF